MNQFTSQGQLRLLFQPLRPSDPTVQCDQCDPCSQRIIRFMDKLFKCHYSDIRKPFMRHPFDAVVYDSWVVLFCGANSSKQSQHFQKKTQSLCRSGLQWIGIHLFIFLSLK